MARRGGSSAGPLEPLQWALPVRFIMRARIHTQKRRRGGAINVYGVPSTHHAGLPALPDLRLRLLLRLRFGQCFAGGLLSLAFYLSIPLFLVLLKLSFSHLSCLASSNAHMQKHFVVGIVIVQKRHSMWLRSVEAETSRSTSTH